MKLSTLLSLLLLSLVALSAFVSTSAALDELSWRTEGNPIDDQPPTEAFVSSRPSPIISFSSATASPVHPATSAPTISTAATPVSHSSSASPSISSSAHPTPPGLTFPYSRAASTWSIRQWDDSYYWLTNDTAQLGSYLPRPATVVASTLEGLVGDAGQWKRQQKQLDRHVRRVNWHYSTAQPDCGSGNENATCAVAVDSEHSHRSHDDHHGGKHGKYHSRGNSLMGFYLRHAQCRACVASNDELLKSYDTLPYLASYQPAAIMKWCTLATPKLSSEQAPAMSGAPLTDWEGVCMPAEAECPSATVDMNVLSPTTCAADEPATKHSCTLCVLDGYQWQTGKRAFDNADNYAGQCVHPTAATASDSDSDDDYHGRHHRVSVTELDSCPSVVASATVARQYNIMASSFGVFVSVLALLVCCSCLRACCTARKNKQLARVRLANAQAVADAEPGSFSVRVVPAVSSSPTPSAPPAAGYPAAAAAAAQREYQEPLLSSGLNPPRMSVSALYPQLQAQRVAVAQPYAYGRL